MTCQPRRAESAQRGVACARAGAAAGTHKVERDVAVQRRHHGQRVVNDGLALRAAAVASARCSGVCAQLPRCGTHVQERASWHEDCAAQGRTHITPVSTAERARRGAAPACATEKVRALPRVVGRAKQGVPVRAVPARPTDDAWYSFIHSRPWSAAAACGVTRVSSEHCCCEPRAAWRTCEEARHDEPRGSGKPTQPRYATTR